MVSLVVLHKHAFAVALIGLPGCLVEGELPDV